MSRGERSGQPPARQSHRGGQRAGQSGNTTGLRITYLQNPEVEKIKPDKTVGTGVKKTLAYDTPLSKERLDKWREEFWGKSFQNRRRKPAHHLGGGVG